MAKIVSDHNDCCVIVDQINKTVRSPLFSYYYLSMPWIDLQIILLMLDTNIYSRILVIYSISLAMALLFILNIPMSGITMSCKKLYNKLNSIIAKKRMVLSMKLKILNLIERLAGPETWIYCYELFPFTNYELYLYTANCVKFYFLFSSLI